MSQLIGRRLKQGAGKRASDCFSWLSVLARVFHQAGQEISDKMLVNKLPTVLERTWGWVSIEYLSDGGGGDREAGNRSDCIKVVTINRKIKLWVSVELIN